jgi:hypothetical protein
MCRGAIIFAAVGLVTLLSEAMRSAFACEDKHPPIIRTPEAEFEVRDVRGMTVLKLALDPRGVGRVLPIGEAANTWMEPEDRTGAWHYREWQWWKGHPWGDSCRPRFFADVKLQVAQPNAAVLAYRIDGFDCRQVFLMPSEADPDAPFWDVVTTIRNVSGRDVDEYGQFFACYTPLNRGNSFWYWDESNQLVLFADRGVSHLDGYVANPLAYFLDQGAIPHCPRGGGKIVGRWGHPVMVSQASPAGWRSVILLEAAYAASLAQGIEGGAMDYILFPGPAKRTFTDGDQFSAHIRHIMVKSPELPTRRRLEEFWEGFQRSHDAIRQRASAL